MTEMDDAMKKIEAARTNLTDALAKVDRGLTADRDYLNRNIGDLAAMVQRWERERNRWIA